MHPLVEQLRGTLLPAVVTPMSTDGVIAYDALTAYASAIAAEPIGGVAVWAHTGRGLYLSAADRSKVLEAWRRTRLSRWHCKRLMVEPMLSWSTHWRR